MHDPVSAVRAHERVQSRDHPALRAGHRRLQREVRRSAVVAAARGEPRRHPIGSVWRVGVAQHHRRQRGARGRPARRAWPARGWSPAAAPTTTWSPTRVTDQEFPGFADLQAKGVWEPAAGTHADAVRPAQPAGGGARDRRRRRPRRVPGRHRERPGVGPVRRGDRHARAVAHRRRRTPTRARRSASMPRSRTPASGRMRPSDDSFGVANVVFERALDGQGRVAAAGAGLGARHATSSRPAARCIGCRPTCVRRSPAIAIRRRPTARARRAAPGCPTCWIVAAPGDPRRRLAAGHAGRRRRAVVTAGRACGSTGAGSTGETLLSPRCRRHRRASTPAPGCAPPSGATRRAPATRSSRRATTCSTSPATQVARAAQRSGRAGIGGRSNARSAAASTLRVEGYYKRFSRPADRPARDRGRSGWRAWPATTFRPSSPASIPADPHHHDRADQRRPRPRLRLRRVRLAHDAPPADARLRGWASYTWGQARTRGLRPPLSVRVRPPARVHGGAVVPLHHRGGSWRRRRAWPRDFRARRRSACAWPASRTTADRDGDGVTDELLPDGRRRRAARLRGGLRRRRQPEWRTPAAVRARRPARPPGGRAAPRGAGSCTRRSSTCSNRQNAGAFEPQLEYDPTSDRPRIVEERDQAIPRLPTVGVRFRF